MSSPSVSFAHSRALVSASLRGVARHPRRLDFARTFFRCALSVYASEGVVPEPYSAELMDGAWKVRK